MPTSGATNLETRFVQCQGLTPSSTELADFAVQRRAKVTQQAAVGALAQFGQQFAIVLEVDTQDLRQGKNVLTVRNGTEDGLA